MCMYKYRRVRPTKFILPHATYTEGTVFIDLWGEGDLLNVRKEEEINHSAGDKIRGGASPSVKIYKYRVPQKTDSYV